MGLFSFARCVGAAQTVFRCFFREQLSEEVVPYEAADSVRLWEEVSPGSSYVAVLNWNLQGHRNGFITSTHFIFILTFNSYALKPRRNPLLRIFLVR